MKHLSVLGIFWLAIWTDPRGGPGWPGVALRVVVLAWGFYLCRKILSKESNA